MADPVATGTRGQEPPGLRRVILLWVLSPDRCGCTSCSVSMGLTCLLPSTRPPPLFPAELAEWMLALWVSVIPTRAIMPAPVLCPVSFLGSIT